MRRWLALIAFALLAPGVADRAFAATAPPSKAAADIASEKGVLGVRCTRGPRRDNAPTYLCVVKVRGGCVMAQFQYRHGEIGWYSQSAHKTTCWKTEGGPTS